MSYLQNGYCFSTVGAAKADFISRINDIQGRNEAEQFLNTLSLEQLQQFFPDCVPASQVYEQYLAALFPIVITCLCLNYIKKAMQL